MGVRVKNGIGYGGVRVLRGDERRDERREGRREERRSNRDCGRVIVESEV